MATAQKAPTKRSVPARASAGSAAGLAQDRKLVAAMQSYEVSFLSKLTSKSADEVKRAIEGKGHSRVIVVQAPGSGTIASTKKK